MAGLTIRGLDPELLRRLKVQAARNGRSAAAEVRAILERFLGSGADEFWARAAELRARTRGRNHTDSATLIRADWDRRSGLAE